MQISIRELKANPSHAIALMQSGVRVQITSHRKVVAELTPPRPVAAQPQGLTDDDAMAHLLASGLVVQPATHSFQLPEPLVFAAGPGGQTMSDLVLELRGPR